MLSVVAVEDLTCCLGLDSALNSLLRQLLMSDPGWTLVLMSATFTLLFLLDCLVYLLKFLNHHFLELSV